MKTTAGRRDRRVKVQQPIEAADTYGEAVPTWRTVCERWVSLEPLSGREAEQARSVVATATHRVRMLYLPVTPKWRLIYRSRVLNIGSVANLNEANEELEILVTEQV